MAAKAVTSKPAQDEVDEMFSDLEAGAAGNGSDDDFDDLLDAVEEDDSEGWVPAERGEGIAGTVVKVGQARSDFVKDGEDPMVPSVTIQTSGGDKFRIIGFGTVLRREMLDQNPHVGDKVAVKYFGEKPIKRGKYAGKPYKHFGMIVRPAPQDQRGQSLADAQNRS